VLTLSPSRIKTWIRCRKSYYWRYNCHLSRIQKESPLALGSLASKIFEAYYKSPVEDRTQAALVEFTVHFISQYKEEFLGKEPKPDRTKEWDKIVKILSLVFSQYKAWAEKYPTISDKDFQIVEVETSRTIHLTEYPFSIDLLAIPDAVVLFHNEPTIFEHKLRYKYRNGDFGIDIQSIGSCLVTNSMGTIYNAIEYSKQKLHRDLIIRSPNEVEYFKKMFIDIGNDILTCPLEHYYPQPMKKCSCSYWELCVAEMQGSDVEDIINELFVIKHREDHKDHPEEQKENTKVEIYKDE
jgi:hypothetical protein